MKTTIVLIATTLLLTLSSCAIFQSKQTRAQNHLGKAIKLDPSIIKSTQKDSINILDSVRITDSVRIKDSVNVTTKDSVIIIPKSDLNGNITDPCDSTGLRVFDYTLGSGSHRLRIWSDGKTIRYTSSVDSLISRIQSKDTYILRQEQVWKEKEKTYLEKIAKLEKQTFTIIQKPSIWKRIATILVPLVVGLVAGYVYSRVSRR